MPAKTKAGKRTPTPKRTPTKRPGGKTRAVDVEAAKALAGEWRRFGETMTVSARWIEWRGASADAPEPAPVTPLVGVVKIVTGSGVSRDDVEPRRWECRLNGPVRDETERLSVGAKLAVLAHRSCTALGLPVGPSHPAVLRMGPWIQHVSTTDAAEWWTWSGNELSGPIAARMSVGRRVAFIADLAAASADELERLARGPAEQTASAPGTKDAFRPLAWFASTFGGKYPAWYGFVKAHPEIPSREPEGTGKSKREYSLLAMGRARPGDECSILAELDRINRTGQT